MRKFNLITLLLIIILTLFFNENSYSQKKNKSVKSEPLADTLKKYSQDNLPNEQGVYIYLSEQNKFLKLDTLCFNEKYWFLEEKYH